MKLSARGLAAIATLAVAASLGACSSQSSAENSGTMSKNSSPSESTMEKKVNDYGIAFAQCLRDKGINMPDPSPNKGDEIPDGVDPDAMNRAMNECREKIGPAPTEGTGSENSDQLTELGLKTAKCLRGKGYTVPDPKPGQGIAFADVPENTVAECIAEAEK